MNELVFEKIKDFNLEHIFDCGQAFRWKKINSLEYRGVVGKRIVHMEFAPEKQREYEGKLIIRTSLDFDDEGLERRFWLDYLDLNRDYGLIKESFAVRDSVMEKAIKEGQGIRILNQDPWETLISFIISQNNNIPRIQKCIENICREYGDSLDEKEEFFSFPSLEKLEGLKVEDLDSCKLGYRASYIIKTAKKVGEDGIDLLYSLRDKPLKFTEIYLKTLTGVGPKVAHCIMLFSLKKYEMFPLDVWMRRVMHQMYKIDEGDIEGMGAYAEEHFGEYAGIAQQYLFLLYKKLEA